MEIVIQLSDGKTWYHLPKTSDYIKILNIIPNTEDFIELVKDDFEEHGLPTSESPFVKIKHRVLHKNKISFICYREYLK